MTEMLLRQGLVAYVPCASRRSTLSINGDASHLARVGDILPSTDTLLS